MTDITEIQMMLELNKKMLEMEKISDEKFRRAREELLEEMCRLSGGSPLNE